MGYPIGILARATAFEIGILYEFKVNRSADHLTNLGTSANQVFCGACRPSPDPNPVETAPPRPGRGCAHSKAGPARLVSSATVTCCRRDNDGSRPNPHF